MRNVLTLILVAFGLFSMGQDAYFQQQVDVQIDCSLDDVNHVITGNIILEYTNNSPDVLNEIYMHVWPNAYKDRKTAFTKQKLRMNNTEFYFAPEESRGNISNLDFKLNGLAQEWALTKEHKDIALIKLSEPINPGQTVEISTPFELKIPNSFSRLGHVDQSYQITQWFPKPAVYDKNGWHPMPYFDIGEFYSEFGDYKVKITLPENYIICATGEVQEESEKDFLKARVKWTKEKFEGQVLKSREVPESSKKMKTLTYEAKNVHDFAWFADKEYFIQKDTVVLSNGKSIDTWTFFTGHQLEMWKKSIDYVNNSVKFYSDKVGNYPYPQATAVLGALGAGGGMEYPMITIIGMMGSPESLDNVITHEVGHNWFYGILAFNERDHVWLDEGINSYYDHRYMRENYTDVSMLGLPPVIKGHSPLSDETYVLMYKLRTNSDQAPSEHSNKFNDEINYFLGGYEKPAQAFRHLELFLGTEVFDKIMQDFFQKWAFKHPQPDDLRAHFKAATNEDLNWFFDGMIGSNVKLDYALGKYNSKTNELKLKNKGAINAPMPLMATNAAGDTSRMWVGNGEKSEIIQLPLNQISELRLDPDYITLDVQKNNHIYNAEKMFSRFEEHQLQFFSRLDNPERTQTYLIPSLGFNSNDGFMLGLGVHNIGVIQKSFEYALLPMYGFGSSELVGLASVKKHWRLRGGSFKQVNLGLSARRFTDRRSDDLDYEAQYLRLNPHIELEFAAKTGTPNRSSLRADWLRNTSEYGFFGGPNEEVELRDNEMDIFRLTYKWASTHAILPRGFELSMEYQDFNNQVNDDFSISNEYLKLSGNLESSFQFAKDRFVSARVYAAYFLLNDRRDRVSTIFPRLNSGGNISLASQANTDYAYDDFYFNRDANEGFGANQIGGGEGGFKVPFNQNLSSYSGLGLSNDFAMSLNLKSNMPFDLREVLPLNLGKIFPVKAYFDIGYFETNNDFLENTMYSGGFMLSYLNETVAFYFPVINSKDVENAYEQIADNYWERISFRVSLKNIDPTRIRNEFMP